MGRPVIIREFDLALAREFARRLTAAVDKAAVRITVFGSRARGDADEESDLDLFVAVDRDDPEKDIEKAAFGIACDLTLESGILVSVLVADAASLRRHEGFAFLEAIEEEGIPLLEPEDAKTWCGRDLRS